MPVSDPGRPPALILCAQIAALALTRRLGRAGLAVGLWDVAPATGPDAPVAMHSRFARWRFTGSGGEDAGWADQLIQVAQTMGNRPVLVPTSDDSLLLISRQRERLMPHFRFLLPDAATLEMLLDKRCLHEAAARSGVPVPRSIPLRSRADLDSAATELGFPCLLKSAYGKVGQSAVSRLAGKVRVANREQLLRAFAALSACDDRLMLQEFLAGGADRVALYNAYFDARSEPIAVFTGRKLRQYPEAFGTACASEACAMPGLAEPLTAWLQQLRYIGPIDIGLKWSEREKVYKLLDVNPRLGQNYRTFVGDDPQHVDLGWLTYNEAAGLPLPQVRPLRALPRRWRIEDDDFRTCRHLYRCGAWSAAAWLLDALQFQSFRHESAYWSWPDPAPLLHHVSRQWRQHRRHAQHRRHSVREEFNHWAERGDAVRMEHEHRAYAERVLERMQLRPGDRVLDLGCGSGWAAQLAAGRLGAYGLAVGLDISDAMLRTANHHGPARLLCASAARMPFPDACFTHVLSVESFYYLPDSRAALSEVRRILAPGGWLYLLMFLYRGNPHARHWQKQIAVPVQLRSAQQWQELLMRSGWAEVRVEQFGPSCSAVDPGGHAWACLAVARHPQPAAAVDNQSSWTAHPALP
ncbi:MAG: methyltransferase domain-containing protein [Acidobacteria bacterium]|nr:MAG: methyltransferase domain-containing protein [Acidobacteriota bacterium]